MKANLPPGLRSRPVAANAISNCTIRSRSDDPDQPGPYTPRARATVPVNVSSLASARIWTLGGRRIPRFLFLLTAREVYTCASAPAVPELAPTRRADHFQSRRCPRISRTEDSGGSGFDEDLLDSAAPNLAKYLIPDGVIPVQPKVYEQVYVVLLEYKGQRKTVVLDATRFGTNTVRIQLRRTESCGRKQECLSKLIRGGYFARIDPAISARASSRCRGSVSQSCQALAILFTTCSAAALPRRSARSLRYS